MLKVPSLTLYEKMGHLYKMAIFAQRTEMVKQDEICLKKNNRKEEAKMQAAIENLVTI